MSEALKRPERPENLSTRKNAPASRIHRCDKKDRYHYPGPNSTPAGDVRKTK